MHLSSCRLALEALLRLAMSVILDWQVADPSWSGSRTNLPLAAAIEFVVAIMLAVVGSRFQMGRWAEIALGPSCFLA